MRIEWRQLGEELVRASAQCKSKVVLIAPFMKVKTLSRIVESLPSSASLVCLTRWRLEELAGGVSDLECWDVISARPNSRLLLRPNLHAKYFRFDDLAFLGSANLTMTALGWSLRPNAEALIKFRVDELDSTNDFESSLLSGVVDVTVDLVTNFKAMLESYPTSAPVAVLPEPNLIVAADHAPVLASSWFPQSRSPEYLYRVYSGEKDVMTTVGLAAAQDDLLALELPNGLPEGVFRGLIASRLTATPIVVRLDKFLAVRRRFGEMRSWLASDLGVSDATDDWQRLMRWLLFFLPNRYEAVTANYSEIFAKKNL